MFIILCVMYLVVDYTDHLSTFSRLARNSETFLQKNDCPQLQFLFIYLISNNLSCFLIDFNEPYGIK